MAELTPRIKAEKKLNPTLKKNTKQGEMRSLKISACTWMFSAQ